ncbi:hypothetical protein [Streptomyces sp. NPDC058385]
MTGILKRVDGPKPGWRDEAAEETPIEGRSNSIRALGGGLPTLGRRRR